MNPLIPMLLPQGHPWGGPQQPRGEPLPARVQAALDFLQQCTVKTQAQLLMNDISSETLEGQILTPSEVEAQGAACDLLTAYFDGKLKGAEGPKLAEAGVVICCPVCPKGEPQSECVLCKGRGLMVAYPVTVNKGG